MSPPSPAASARQAPWVFALAVAVVVAGSLQIARSGYSVDEEFTVFAVRGIQANGVPLLPSSLLYDRGLAYSYVSWLAGFVSGLELPAYRAISVACAGLIALLTFKLVRRLAAETPALLASLLVVTSVPFWATATSGRFYAPFFLLYLATLLSLQSGFLLIVAAAFVCRLTHELAFTLAAVPFLCAIVDRDRRRSWVMATIAVVAGLVAGQALLFAFHALAPTSGETMVRRFFLWQMLNLFERPGERQFMIPLIVMALAWIVSPRRARIVSIVALSLTAMILAFSIALATNTAPLSGALIRGVIVDGSRYPLDMFWHIARTMPLTMWFTLTGLVLRVAGLGGPWPRSERVLHLLWIGWVLWFGVIDSGITTNYLLAPVSFMLMALAVDLHAILMLPDALMRRYRSSAAVPAVIGVAALMAVVAHDQWRGAGSMTARLEAARPTIHADGITGIRNGLRPDDRVACTDELGCLMLVGRIDRWLALDDFVRERFLVRRGDAPVTGVYTGVPAAFRPGDLLAPDQDGHVPARVVIVDIFKDYPIGNSRTWLPKALAEDGLPAVTLLETQQLRVLEISPPERNARLR